MFGYSLNYLIDMEHAVIVDVEVTPTRITMEVDATETMIDRTQDRLGLKPDYVAGDVAYGTAEMLGWLVDRGIDPLLSGLVLWTGCTALILLVSKRLATIWTREGSNAVRHQNSVFHDLLTGR